MLDKIGKIYFTYEGKNSQTSTTNYTQLIY